MDEVIIITDKFNYSGSRFVAAVKVVVGELPHITFDRWAANQSIALNNTKEWVVKSHDFHVIDLRDA